MFSLLELCFGMVFILLAAMVFCNALEHLGEYVGISEGLTGSVFVAVGTALPEAIIPLIALFGGATGNNHVAHGNEVGVGAILGPPLMLSTLSVFLMAFSVCKKRGLNGILNPEKTGVNRDLKFFIFGYFLAILLAVSHNFYKNTLIDITVVAILFLSYFFYVLLTIHASANLVNEGHGTQAESPLYLTRFLRLPINLNIIIIQALLGFAGLIYFAHVFISGIIGASELFHLPVFLLSVVLIPVATELPEKVNSILWIRKGKDTLAMSNITGAMVFQGLLLPVMGILLTNWELPLEKSISCIATFFAVAWLLININKAGYKVKHFIVNGAIYILSLIFSLMVFN